MTYSTTTPRTLTLLSTLALCSACPGSTADDGSDGTDTADTGTAASCADPGSDHLDGARPAPPPMDPGVLVCATGWGSDAPRKNPSWTIQLGESQSEFFFAPLELDAHPDGGVIVVGTGVFARYDSDGQEVWSADVQLVEESEFEMVVEDAGTIVLSRYNWSNENLSLDRYDADGSLVGEVVVPWNSVYPNVWGLTTFGPDLVIGAFDEDEEGIYETTLLRLDPTDAVVLRKSTSQVGGQLLTTNGMGTVVFGSFPGFMVSLEDGAVLGMLSPSTGFPAALAGGDEQFYGASSANADLTVGGYSNFGTERWLQSYDRAGASEQGRAIDVADDGTAVVVGTTQVLDFTDTFWFGSQPLVLAVDADGSALWIDWASVQGDASAVAIGDDGVYMAGVVEADASTNVQPDLMMYLSHYDR